MRGKESNRGQRAEVAHSAPMRAKLAPAKKAAGAAKGFALDMHAGEDDEDAGFRHA